MANTQFRWDTTINALRAETGMVGGEIAVVEGYFAAGDGGGGTFYFDNTTVSWASALTGATNASPIAVTTGAAHGLVTGQRVIIDGVVGNTAANGIWIITVTSTTTFTLAGSSGNGAYVSGGAVGDGGQSIPSAATLGLWRRLS